MEQLHQYSNEYKLSMILNAEHEIYRRRAVSLQQSRFFGAFQYAGVIQAVERLCSLISIFGDNIGDFNFEDNYSTLLKEMSKNSEIDGKTEKEKISNIGKFSLYLYEKWEISKL